MNSVPAFSTSREFDYVRVEGLARATGRPPHEWDLYIVKELIDNALDADDELWQRDRTQPPRIGVRVAFLPVSDGPSQELEVVVRNRTNFPVEQIPDIFATEKYASRKAFLKGVTRGSLGNALKTLLGIPYALHHRWTGEWEPMLHPLSIRCSAQRYFPTYRVDATRQTITFQLDEMPFGGGRVDEFDGTEIRVGVDHFVQSAPRSLLDLEHFATQYALSNPHAAFSWEVEIAGETWARHFSPDPMWSDKYSGLALAKWYSPAGFRDFLAALYRKEYGDDTNKKFPVANVCEYFALTGGLPKGSLTVADVEGKRAVSLHKQLCDRSPGFDPNSLGHLGQTHIRRCLSEMLSVEGSVAYQTASNTTADGVPFIVEAAAAYLTHGKRQLWTSLNFTPTYDDPFFSRRLDAPGRPGDSVVGVRGLLDAQGIRHEAPAVVFLHLVCPAVEHTDFGKSSINHLPFQRTVSEVLGQLLLELSKAREEEKRRQEQVVLQSLNGILAEVGDGDRLIFAQLIEQLRIRLRDDAAASAWLRGADALARLKAHLDAFSERELDLSQHLARASAGHVAIPQHPDRHFALPVEYLTADLLTRHHVNKILILQSSELEPLVLANNWLCTWDLALLQNSEQPYPVRDAFLRAAIRCRMPLLLLHDADLAGMALADKVRVWMRELHLDESRVVDLGLDGTGAQRLVEMMPADLADWLGQRLRALGVHPKSLPDTDRIRKDIRERFDQLLLSHLWEGVAGLLGVPGLIEHLDTMLGLTQAMVRDGLDVELERRLLSGPTTRSYSAVRDVLVGEFFADFLKTHGESLRELVRDHMTRPRGDKQ